MREFHIRQKLGLKVFLTGAEAFPALERAFLDARTEIWGSFRIFDLGTRLRSDEARMIGDTWFDLMVHTLSRGIRVRMVLTDFDPTVRPQLHALTWASIRKFHAAAEIAGENADLDVVPSMHSAETGVLPRLILWPVIMRALFKNCRWLNDLDPEVRHATLRDVPGLARNLVSHGTEARVRPRFTTVPKLFPATHHQKLAVFDRRLLYIGGLDLNDRRYDTPSHDRPGPETWQDVQIMLDGQAADEAQRHLETFLSVVAGRRDPPHRRQLVRTLSRRRRSTAMHFGPAPVANEIALGHELLAQRAKKLIYIETQFLRDRRLARAVASAGRSNPALGMILVLPAAPEDVAFDASDDLDARYGEFLQWRCLQMLRKVFRERLFIGAAAQPRAALKGASKNGRDRLRGAELVYIHSKVSIFDEADAIVSSANLNGRSLRWDTEAGLILSDAIDVLTLKRRVFSHWLPDGAGSEFHDPETAVREWRRLAIQNSRRSPQERQGFLLPYDLKAAERHALPLPGIPEEMV